MELQIPYSFDNSILDDASPVIYRKGKIMYHLDLPYREMCDSDHYSICTKVQKANNIWKDQSRHRTNIKKIVRMERRRNHRSRGLPRSHTFAGIHTAKDKRIKFHGILKRQEQFNDLRQTRKSKVSIWKSRILVQRVCRYREKEQKGNSGIIRNQLQ